MLEGLGGEKMGDNFPPGGGNLNRIRKFNSCLGGKN
jgi:hypothetical protein